MPYGLVKIKSFATAAAGVQMNPWTSFYVQRYTVRATRRVQRVQ